MYSKKSSWSNIEEDDNVILFFATYFTAFFWVVFFKVIRGIYLRNIKELSIVAIENKKIYIGINIYFYVKYCIVAKEFCTYFNIICKTRFFSVFII